MRNRRLLPIFAMALAICATAVIPIASTGCKTVTTQVVDANGVTNQVSKSELDPIRTSEAIRTIVSTAVPFAIEKDAHAIAYFRGATIVLRAAAEGGRYDPDALQATLNTISVKEVRSPEAKACINAALGIYRAYFGEAVNAKLDQNEWVKPVLLALANGINDGLPPL